VSRLSQQMFVQRQWQKSPYAVAFLIALLLGGLFSTRAEAGDCRVFFPAAHTGWVIETPTGKVYVIDPGVEGEFYASGKQGMGLGTYLKQRNIKQIDGVVISHPHPDHYNAGVQLFQDFRVLELIDTGFNPRKNATGGYHAAFWKAFKASGATHRTGLHAGALLNWDPQLTVKVCGPKAPFWTEAEAGNDPERFYNQNSFVLWVKHGGVSYLFTGDITPPAQKFLRRSAATEIAATAIFSVPHHGKYYLDREFAGLVGSEHPSLRLAVASKSHTKKGPKADRVPAWRQAGITVLTGDKNNSVTVTSSGAMDFEVKTTSPAKVQSYTVGR
jgi:competence protein ComEC